MSGQEKLKLIYQATLQSPYFKDVDCDGIYEIIVDDQAFKYWHGSYADTPSHEVILSLDGNTYKPSRRLMFKAALSPQELQKTVARLENQIKPYKKVCKRGTKAMTSEVWIELVDLLYSHNAAAAKEILHRLYPKNTKLAVTSLSPEDGMNSADIETVEQFWSSLISQAKKSQYAQTLFSGLRGPVVPVRASKRTRAADGSALLSNNKKYSTMLESQISGLQQLDPTRTIKTLLKAKILGRYEKIYGNSYTYLRVNKPLNVWGFNAVYVFGFDPNSPMFDDGITPGTTSPDLSLGVVVASPRAAVESKLSSLGIRNVWNESKLPSPGIRNAWIKSSYLKKTKEFPNLTEIFNLGIEPN